MRKICEHCNLEISAKLQSTGHGMVRLNEIHAVDKNPHGEIEEVYYSQFGNVYHPIGVKHKGRQMCSECHEKHKAQQKEK